MRAATLKSGFSLVETLIAVSLMVILFVKLTMVVNEASRAHRRESVSMALEDQAQQVIDRISYAIIGSDPDEFFPDPSAPFFTPQLQYRVSMGVEDGEPVWSDPEIIGLAADPSQLFWGQNVGQPGEQTVIWCRRVAQFFESELSNGADDNAQRSDRRDGAQLRARPQQRHHPVDAGAPESGRRPGAAHQGGRGHMQELGGFACA